MAAVEDPKQIRSVCTVRPPLSWNQIAAHISMIEGKEITRQRVQAVAQKAMKKLAEALKDDPVVRDYLETTKDAQADRT